MKWLPRCLENCKDNYVIIVDNGSTDGTVPYIKENFPQITLLIQNANLGFGQANNLGIKRALMEGVDYVFLLNQDAYLFPDCLQNLILVQKKNLDFGILSPVHLNGEGNRLDRNFSIYMSYRNNKDFYSDFVLNKPLKLIYEVPFVNAAGWLLSRSILETVGGFDPLFFHYGEDENYCQRAKYHGFKIGVVPKAFMNHDREERQSAEEQTGGKENFLNQERRIKVRYGDINTENFEKLKVLKFHRIKQKWWSYLKLDFQGVRHNKMAINSIAVLQEKIKISRTQNKIKGKTYLE